MTDRGLFAEIALMVLGLAVVAMLVAALPWLAEGGPA